MYGDVDYVYLVQKSRENIQTSYFAGNVTVTGTVGSGKVIQKLHDSVMNQDVDAQVSTTRACAAGVFSMTKGVLATGVPVTEVLQPMRKAGNLDFP